MKEAEHSKKRRGQPLPVLAGRAEIGFTLIELLVVFTLLALLLSIAVPRYLSAVDNSREKVRQQNLATLRDALDKFKADQGRYPNELGELVTKQYLRALPKDPVTDTQAWVPLSHPAGLESGVYDVAPPRSDGASAQALPMQTGDVAR
jgi:general secretion pathway protein G